MNDVDFHVLTQRCDRMLAEWCALLGLQAWRIEIEYLRDPTEMLFAAPQPIDMLPVMDVQSAWQYLTAKVRVNAPACAQLDDRTVEQSLVHELCHLLVDEMHEWSDDDAGMKHEERVVTQLANALLAARHTPVDEEHGS